MHLSMLEGVFPAVVTPFDEEGQLDVAALTSNIKQWNEYGLYGYLINGSTGETPFLTDAERTTTIETARANMADGMFLLAGAGRESTAQTIVTVKAAAEAGADAALIITPSFYKGLMTGDALEKHYRRVADASPIPIMLYNVPQFTKVWIPVETVARLAEHPNIIGIKDSAGNTPYLAKLIRQVPVEFSVLSGSAPNVAQAFLSGANGAILAVANLIPEICVALFRAAQGAHYPDMQRLHNLILPVSEVTGGGYGIGGLKYAMRLLQYKAGYPRAPLLSPTPQQEIDIQRALQEIGLLKID